MVVDDIDVLWPSLSPAETDSVSIIDADTVLALTISFEPFETVGWWCSKIVELPSLVELIELALSNSPEFRRTSSLPDLRRNSIENGRRTAIGERANHVGL